MDKKPDTITEASLPERRMSKKKIIVLSIGIYLIIHMVVQGTHRYIVENRQHQQKVAAFKEEYQKGYQAGIEYTQERTAGGDPTLELPEEEGDLRDDSATVYLVGYVSGLVDGCHKTTFDCSQPEAMLQDITVKLGEENLKVLQQ